MWYDYSGWGMVRLSFRSGGRCGWNLVGFMLGLIVCELVRGELLGFVWGRIGWKFVSY